MFVQRLDKSVIVSNTSVSLFSDVNYNPILVSELADAVNNLVEKNSKGVFNVVSHETISKLDFGHLLAEEFNLDQHLIQSSKLSDRKELVDRPLNMTLSTSKLNNEGVFVKSLKEQLRELKSQRPKLENELANKKIIPYGRQNISKEDKKPPHY